MIHIQLAVLTLASQLSAATGFLQAVLYFVITIFILVSVHEFGHFIAGRIFGMHVPVFSVGMGRRVLGWNRYNGFTFGPLNPETEVKLGEHTDYRLSMLPFGGYAKIDGMIDETQTEELSTEVQPWEFRAKPWWQKSIVISAGVIMNALLAWFIFSMHNYVSGQDIVNTTTVGYVETHSVSYRDGVRPGDKVVAVNGKPVENWDEVMTRSIRDNIGRDYTVTYSRNGQPYTVAYHSREMGSVDSLDVMESKFGLWPIGFGAPQIKEVTKGSPAAAGGLEPGDVITAVNGEQITTVQSLIDQISSHPNQAIALEWTRGGKPMATQVTPSAKGVIGVQLEASEYTGPKKHVSYGIFESARLGWNNLWTNVALTFRSIGMIFSGKIAAGKALGGPIKIAQLATQSAANGAAAFFTFMALLSMSLALLNILPVPALDGGHLIIILIEAAVGHELSQRFKLGFQKVGVALLLCLMAFMIFNDIRGL